MILIRNYLEKFLVGNIYKYYFTIFFSFIFSNNENSLFS